LLDLSDLIFTPQPSTEHVQYPSLSTPKYSSICVSVHLQSLCLSPNPNNSHVFFFPYMSHHGRHRSERFRASSDDAGEVQCRFLHIWMFPQPRSHSRSVPLV